MAVVTFTTDFGAADGYAAAMKGVVLSLAPQAILVDISHAVPHYNIAAGAITLAQAAPFFPPGSVHVAVVDPGVGGTRADLVVETEGGVFVGPDNGLLSMAARLPRKAFRIENPGFRHEPASPTFHGRDVFAVAAGRIAAGAAAREAGTPLSDIIELSAGDDGPLVGECHGRVVHVDSFGNLVTSWVGGQSGGRWQLLCDGRRFDLEGGRTYGDVPSGAFVLYEGSSGRMEIAVREGSAAALTGAQTGSTVALRRQI
jgi:S-adenosyl-L-methionine hydrolase (adenosine-forming)